MTSRRPYRDALPLDNVIAEIERCSGSQFDPNVANAFLGILRNNYKAITDIQEEFRWD